MNLKAMTDLELDKSAISFSEKERAITLVLLNHLNEIERRHLFSKFSCSSLHDYCVKRLKMDQASAGRHVSAARLLLEVPEMKEKIKEGSTSVTTLAEAGVFFRREARLGKKFDLKGKRELVEKLDSKTTREAQKILLSESSNPEIHFKERITQKTESITEVRLHLDEETIQNLNRLKELWSHVMPHASFADLIKRAAKESVAQMEEKRTPKKACKVKTPAPEWKPMTASETESAAPLPLSKAEIRRQIWLRDESQCTFIDPRTGEVCGSKHFVEEDHILPKAMGGEYTLENIRLRCRAHNQRHAIDTFGVETMRGFFN